MSVCVQLLGRAQHTPPLHLPFHKESFPSTESCLPDSLLCFLLPLPSPPPCVIGLQWSMAADEVLRRTDRNTRGSGTNKKDLSTFLSLGPLHRRYLAAWFTVLHSHSSACCLLSVSLWCLTSYFFFFLPPPGCTL